MKKMFISVLILLLIIPSVLAINIKVEKISSDEVMIFGVDKPVVFNLRITNLGPANNLEIYNLLGFKMFPIGTIPIGEGQTKEIKLEVSPIGEFSYKGVYTFEYFIRGQDSTEIKEKLTFKIIELGEAFELGAGNLDVESNSLKVYLHNKEKFNFGGIHAKFSSAFFEFEKDFNIGPNERKDFDVELNKEEFNKLIAGFYTLNAEISASGQKAEIEGVINFIEKDIVTTIKKDYGLIINTKTIEKANEGNVLSPIEIVVKKNIISRLFTSFNPVPDSVNRKGVIVDYTWSNELKPGEAFKVSIKTNWTLPLLIIIFIIVIVILTKKYSKTDLVLKKRVSFVNVKGGEFALKISVLINAKKYIEKVTVIDRLPQLTHLHERFGGEVPTRVNEKNRKIEWDFEKLEAGESRMLSYIIYSKIGVVGKFALPKTTAVYERGGEIHESESNRTFFLAEPRKRDEGE